MVLHVKDEETDWMVRDFAKRRGVGITMAIKIAINEASEVEKGQLETLEQELEPLLEKIRSRRNREGVDQKAFMDDLWGEKA